MAASGEGNSLIPCVKLLSDAEERRRLNNLRSQASTEGPGDIWVDSHLCREYLHGKDLRRRSLKTQILSPELLRFDNTVLFSDTFHFWKKTNVSYSAYVLARDQMSGYSNLPKCAINSHNFRSLNKLSCFIPLLCCLESEYNNSSLRQSITVPLWANPLLEAVGYSA